MPQQLNSNNLEICHAARAQLRGEFLASARTSKIAHVLQVLIFTVSCLFASKLPAQDLQIVSQAIATQAKNSPTATQEQNAKNSQNAAQSQNAQDSQAPHAQAPQDLQNAIQAQNAQDLTAPQEKKEEKMQKCDFYPVTDFFNLMEQIYDNLDKICLLSRETANWEATGFIVLHNW